MFLINFRSADAHHQTDKSSYWWCSIKKAVPKNFGIFPGITCVEVSFGARLKSGCRPTGHKACNFIKKRFQHCKYCKISNNTCFEEHLHRAASENNEKRFPGKVTGRNDHCRINMVGQRPRIGSNWPLTDSYLQRCNGFTQISCDCLG